MKLSFCVCSLMLLLGCGSAAQAATYCATSGNQLNIALNDAGHNGEDDDIRVAVGTHITDYHFPTTYQWSIRNTNPDDFDKDVTISGGWNGANNCQTQISLDPSQTVLDARYWGPVFLVLLANSIPGEVYAGTFTIRNMTFNRGKANFDGHTTGLRILDPLSAPGSIVVDNVLVTNGQSAFQFAAALNINVGGSGSIRLRNSIISNNTFTGANSTPVFIGPVESVIAYVSNNSVFGNSVTSAAAGMHVWNIANVSNNAIADNVSTANPYYQYFSDAPTQMTLTKNHFGSEAFVNGAPFSEVGTTMGDPAWSQVGVRMVPDAVSPLRDSGENAPVGQVPNIDFSGNPRIVNLIIDRGAVEADAPPASEVGPLVTAVSPENGSTTVLQGAIGGGFIGTQLTFNVSGGVSPGVTELECSVTSGGPAFGIASPGETVGVGGSITPIDVGFDDITSELQYATVTCAVKRELAGTSYLTFNFVAAPPGGPAVFDSDPKAYPDPAYVIKLTPGLPAIVGADVLPKSVKLYNTAQYGSSDLRVFFGPSGGSNPQITINPQTINGGLIPPQGVLEVEFDCDTSAPGNYFANWGGPYDLDQEEDATGDDGDAFFRVECEVRPPPETHVETTPSSGTTTTRVASPGGSASFEFSFAEVSPDPDPPADAFLDNCFIDGADQGRFSIDSPAFPGGPYPIVKLAPQTVQVTGSDNGSKNVYTANLNCEYSDSDHPSSGGSVIFPLVLNVRGDARFRVGKDFTDGQNPTEVEVSITCNTGLPLQQTQTISETQDVVFVVESFDPGALDCTVSEDALTGYDTSYSASGDSDNSDEPQGCVFTDVAAGDDNACLITNAPAPVDVVITKEWVFEGSTETDVDTHYELTLHCDAEIVGGNDSFSGVGPDTFTAQVIPGYPASHCYVDEHVYDDAVEVDNGCAELVVSAGSGDECTITNTVFFEGIPALNPYGLAVLALLTLGMGFVVMRRIA